MQDSQTTWRYEHVAWCYDALAAGYSLGAIRRSKLWHTRLMRPGMRVLYVGAGAGADVAQGLSCGTEATCIEPSARMRARLNKRLSSWGGRYRILPSTLDIAALDQPFDLVVAHYFLNLFDEQSMPRQLDHLVQWIAPGGRIIISDFAACRGNSVWRRALAAMYYRPVNIIGWGLGICALHPIYDYAPLLLDRGLEVDCRVGFSVVPGLPSMYETLVARKVSA